MLRFAPHAAVVAALLAVIVALLPPRVPRDAPDFEAFGRIPAVSGGRVKPLDTVARNALLETSGRSFLEIPATDGGKARRMGHNEWLAQTLFDSRAAGGQAVILVENEEVKALFDRQDSKEKRFSMEELAAASNKIEQLARQALAKPAGHRDVFERQVVALYDRVTVIGRLFHSVQPPGLVDYKRLLDALPSLAASAAPELEKLQRGEEHDGEALRRLSGVLQAFQGIQRLHAFYAIPPRDPAAGLQGWRDIGSAVLDEQARGIPHPAVEAWARIADAYHRIADDNGAAFNAETRRFLDWIDQSGMEGLGKEKSEWWFNHLGPFYLSLQFYVAAFLIVLAAWATGSPHLLRAAFALLLATLVVHTLGLGMRIWLSGRPPVTNLYSSAVFTGWGVLGLCLVLEKLFLRNGIGSAVAALIGFATLLIAHHLSFDGDTLEVKRAVLDSNFWLATHVVVVTLGYCATFLAGIMAVVWLGLRLAKARFFDARARRATAGCVYATVCFALLFSFTGTVLGGIWADQSWGRFWGWDPKENGAVMIVLWNAIILHARWGGLARERGIMALAMGGNIITAWSWFGTNMLGIGLHSYGFMDSAFYALLAFVAGQLLLIAAVALVPREGGPCKDPPPASPDPAHG
jgi:ABC-type transport system involved in cytochrome c biogenesis permease subunit